MEKIQAAPAAMPDNPRGMEMAKKIGLELLPTSGA